MKHATRWALALLLLARGASAGDDAKPPAPAQPVDVPGFWTADELRRIDEGLDVLNCTRKDLGFQKRPIDDPFRLEVVNKILDEPLAIGPVAAEWDAVARTGDPGKLLHHARKALDLESPVVGLDLMKLSAPEIEARLPESTRPAFRALMQRIQPARDMGMASELKFIGDESLHTRHQPESELESRRRSLVRKALATQVDHPQQPIDAPDMDDAKFLELVRKVRMWAGLLDAHSVVHSVADFVRALKEADLTSLRDWKDTIRVKTQIGDIVLSGFGDDVHDEDGDIALLIDLGGNDTYTHGASANLLKNRPVQVVIDLAGDDRYIGENDFSFGGALGGVAIQWDCGGNDTYRGGNCSCGAGILGVGILVDEGGDDVYRVKDFGEGAGAFGIGLLLDKAGNDSYHADLYGQGFASTWGCGMLVELAGNDVYDAGGAHVDEPLWRDRYQSLSQGFAIGGRPDRSGGVGVLVDVSGNDRYSCDIFGQGCSYWYSLGLLIDDDGHDTYACGQYGQGSGIYLSCGMLLDRHGQDNYYDANGVGMGGAHDYAVGFLVDRDGDDYYSGGGCAQGSGHTNSVGMLIDDAGDDGYSTVRGVSQGGASWTRNTGGIGLLLDGAGKDQYSETTRNDGVAVRDTIGACIDEPTPEGKPSANPMNAAISKEDAAKKVDAEGKKDGAWDLDKLWALVTAWEVGDNTVVMPIAREQWFALGKPALDRAFENLNDKHGLIYRGIELTLAEFAKSDRAGVIERLVEKSKDADATIRKNSVKLLASLLAKEALPRLTEMLVADADSQTAVLAALAALKTAPPEVVALLKSPKESVGVQAAVCLGAVGGDGAIDALVAALGPDFAFPVRLAAQEQIGALGFRAAVAASAVAGNPEAPMMQRRNALRALGRSKSIAAAAGLVNGFNDPDRWIRFSAVLATNEFLSTFPSSAPPGAGDDAVGAQKMRAGLESALEGNRANEADPLVKRLVTPPGEEVIRRALVLAFVAAILAPAPLVAQDAPPVAIRFLDRKEAAVAIVDETAEPYFSILQPLEMLAKTSVPLEATDLAKQRDECRQRYRDAVREFTDDEKAAVTDAVNEIHDALRTAYPLFAETPWTFLKLDNSIEGGFPHTRGPAIVMPDWMAQKMAQAFAAKLRPARSRFGETLIHEQTHVVQRAHPALFEDLYVHVWGFIRAKGLPSCPWLVRQQIVNPDGVDVGWVFPSNDGKSTTYWQPLVTLADGVARPRMGKDFVTVGVALDRKGASFVPRVPKDAKDGKPEMRELELVEGYTAAFGRVPENFHPNETSAVLFSWLAMQEHVAREGPGLVSHAEVDFTKFRAWCRAKMHR